jgi:hypothetical protein
MSGAQTAAEIFLSVWKELKTFDNPYQVSGAIIFLTSIGVFLAWKGRKPNMIKYLIPSSVLGVVLILSPACSSTLVVGDGNSTGSGENKPKIIKVDSYQEPTEPKITCSQPKKEPEKATPPPPKCGECTIQVAGNNNVIGDNNVVTQVAPEPAPQATTSSPKENAHELPQEDDLVSATPTKNKKLLVSQPPENNEKGSFHNWLRTEGIK